jgi:hypothetical protein
MAQQTQPRWFPCTLQIAEAACAAGADGAAELAALVTSGGLSRSSTATAVYDARYRPFAARQARSH